MIPLMIHMKKAPQRILFVDDEPYHSRQYVEELELAGYEVIAVSTVKSALAQAKTRDFDAVILDVMLPPGGLGYRETQGGYKTGIALAKKLRDALPDARILALTLSTDPEVERWFTNDDSVAYASKISVSPHDLARLVENLIAGERRPRVFIVHGRNIRALSGLKSFLNKEFGIADPIVLAERPSKGRTLIEKFEQHAQNIDVVFVLATADDLGRLAKSSGAGKPRARQNVVFELGFFLGALKRTSGRVVLLYEDAVELPSDLSGVVYINITKGIGSAEAEVRRELAGWID
jgi:predicted nucleotide-binding protein